MTLVSAIIQATEIDAAGDDDDGPGRDGESVGQDGARQRPETACAIVGWTSFVATSRSMKSMKRPATHPWRWTRRIMAHSSGRASLRENADGL